MAHFILLSLLLAIIQLPLVSVKQIVLREGTSATIKFIGTTYLGAVPLQCHGAVCSSLENNSDQRFTVEKEALTIHNLTRSDSNTQFCKDYSYFRQCADLLVKRGCVEDESFFDFSEGFYRREDMVTLPSCREVCALDRNCQYYTYNELNHKCFLMSSKDNVVARFKEAVTSGYTSRKCEGVVPYFYSQSLSWIGALKHCRSLHSSLVEINNSSVQQAVIDLLQEEEGIEEGVWIGLERAIFGINPPWTWVSGQPAEDSPLHRSSSVDPLNHHCGKIIPVDDDFQWVDANCHEQLPFVCQTVRLPGDVVGNGPPLNEFSP